MPRPAHTRLTWRGVFGTPTTAVETWQFSLATPEDVTALAQTGRNALAESLADAWSAHLRGLHISTVVLTEVEVRRIGADGREPRDAAGAFTGQGRTPAGLAIAGNGNIGTNAVYPPHVAVVASLTTARAGASGKGRIFLPPTVHPVVNTDFLLSAAHATSIRDSVAQFLQTLDGPAGLPIHVMSSKGFSSKVTGVRVGRALDTQRSRRRSLLESYSTRTLEPQ